MTDFIQHLQDFQGLYAAFVGAMALILTFIITVIMTFKFHKSDNLAASKLNIYIDLTEKYTDYLIFILFNRDMKTKKVINKSVDKFRLFLIAYNKACLLSTSETKKEMNVYLEQITDLHKIFLENSPNLLISAYEIEEKAIKLSWVLRNELAVKNDMKIEHEILAHSKKRNSEVALNINQHD